MTETVRSLLEAKFHNGTPLSIELILEVADPLDVRAVFRYKNGGGEWRINFMLIENGLKTGSAERDDVRLIVEGATACLTLEGEDGTAKIFTPTRGLMSFRDKGQKAIERAVDASLKSIVERK